MAKLFGLVVYVLIAALALKFLGSWTLYLSLGVPLLVVIGYVSIHVIYFLFANKKKRGVELRGEVIEFINKADENKSLPDNNIAQRMGLSFESNDGHLPAVLLELSSKWLGKFIGYMLKEREYPDKLYLSILRNLRQHKRDVDIVIAGVGAVNPTAMERFFFLLNKETD